MDKKSQIVHHCLWVVSLLLTATLQLSAQKNVEILGVDYNYDLDDDCITLQLKSHATKDLKELREGLAIYENGKKIDNGRVDYPSSQRTIPRDYTFSVLVDLRLSQDEKDNIYDAVASLVKSAPDSCVYLSFFGDEVSSSEMVTTKNIGRFKDRFEKDCKKSYLYDAVYAKLVEFGSEEISRKEKDAKLADEYIKNSQICSRAKKADNRKNILVLFTDGRNNPNEEWLTWRDCSDYQENTSDLVPRVYIYYFGSRINPYNEGLFIVLSKPRDGSFKKSDSQMEILSDFQQKVENEKYNFEFVYSAAPDAHYTGKVSYVAVWDDETASADSCNYAVGTQENPWPRRHEATSDFLLKYFVALMVACLMIALFFFVMKILVPWVKQKSFSMKYYKIYQPERGVQRRSCNYCRQEIEPGEKYVNRCKHYMHVHCWKQNGYQCAEYGQNCKTGIQSHVDWEELKTWRSFKDCQQAIMGIIAGLVSWVVYEVMGRGILTSWAASIAGFFITGEQQQSLLPVCTTKVSAFLTIGLLLGFFLSLAFRNGDEYRQKNWAVYLKILGLSLFSAVIGMLSFAVGGMILCMLLSQTGTTFIPWYCSLPAYLLFSICTSLSLTVKSSIPVKSAMIGGLLSAFIGFLVLYFTDTLNRFSWMNMLLDFIIYGGGLGASLVTVRMLAEHYFLVIKNGVKAGQRIPIHKWMSATGGSNKVTIGQAGNCEIQMNWEKSGKVAKEHVQLYIDQGRQLPVMKPMAAGVVYNSRAELPVGRQAILSNGDTFKVGDTIFQYLETD